MLPGMATLLCENVISLGRRVRSATDKTGKLLLENHCSDILRGIFDICLTLRVDLAKACKDTVFLNEHESQVKFRSNEVSVRVYVQVLYWVVYLTILCWIIKSMSLSRQ